VQIHVEEALCDLVSLPDLVEQGLCHHDLLSPAATTA
jgi:hypothetical protein